MNRDYILEDSEGYHASYVAKCCSFLCAGVKWKYIVISNILQVGVLDSGSSSNLVQKTFGGLL